MYMYMYIYIYIYIYRHLRGLTRRLLGGVSGWRSSLSLLLEASGEALPERLLRWVRLDVRNVHIRYEDTTTSPQFNFSGGVVLSRLAVGDAAAHWDGDVAKFATACVSAYWQSYEAEPLVSQANWRSWVAQRLSGKVPDADGVEGADGADVVDNSGEAWPAHEVLPPTEIEVNLSFPCHRTSGRLGVDIAVPELVPRLTQVMIRDLLCVAELAERWRELLRLQALRLSVAQGAAAEPAVRAPPGRAHGRWRCALLRVQRLLREGDLRRHVWGPEAWRLLRLHRLYLDLATQEGAWTEAALAAGEAEAPLSEELEGSLARLEAVLPLGLLELWRLQAAGHASVPQADLEALGIVNDPVPNRLKVLQGSPRSPSCRPISEDGSDSASPQRVCDGSDLGLGPVRSGRVVGALSVSLSARCLGVELREVVAPHPFRRVPFEIVSRSGYSSGYH